MSQVLELPTDFKEGLDKLALSLDSIQKQLPQAQGEQSKPFEELSLRSLMPTKEDLPLLIAGIGAGSATAISGMIQKNVSQLAGYRAEFIQAGVGYFLYKFFQTKQRYVSAFGGGVLIGAIASLAQAYGFTVSALGIHGAPVGGAGRSAVVGGRGSVTGAVGAATAMTSVGQRGAPI